MLMQRRDAALDNLQIESPARQPDSSTAAFTPTTPGDSSTYSFSPSPGIPVRTQAGLGLQPADLYYRPPRQRRQTLDVLSPASRTSMPSQKRMSVVSTTPLGAPFEVDGQPLRGEMPNPYAQIGMPLTPRTDYSTREVDFYYGVSRGERLNSGGPNRKLGTGPADPTGPMASAAGWLRTMFGAKRKDKGKGFEVVRSARMPPNVSAFEDEAPPQGIPVAMGVIRSGPIDSDEDDAPQSKPLRPAAPAGPDSNLLDDDQDEDTVAELRRPTPLRFRGMSETGVLPPIPDVSDLSSSLSPSGSTSSRLPVEQLASPRRLPVASSSQGDPQVDLLGDSAELVDERRS
jgi:hypothetical protein